MRHSAGLCFHFLTNKKTLVEEMLQPDLCNLFVNPESKVGLVTVTTAPFLENSLRLEIWDYVYSN